MSVTVFVTGLYKEEAGMKKDHEKQNARSLRAMHENSGLYYIQSTLLNSGFLVLWIQMEVHNLVG